MGKRRADNNNNQLKRSWWNLVDDANTGRIETSKVWLHLGNAFASYKFLQIPAKDISVDMVGTYLAIITMGHAGLYWLKNRGVQDGGAEVALGQQDSDSSDSTAGSDQHVDVTVSKQVVCSRPDCVQKQPSE